MYYPDIGIAAIDVVELGDAGCESATQIGDPCTDGSVVGGVRQGDDKYSYILANGADKFRVLQYESEGDPFGGNVLVEGGAEILFPLPFIKDQSSVRTAFFIDVGNVFSTHCGPTQLNCSNFDAGELRYSFGVGLSWITGFGPLTFSYAKPGNDSDEDETEAFQFSLGRSF